MRIVHVYKDYFPVLGGVENYIRWVAHGQAERGHDVTVLVTNPDGWQTTVEQEGEIRVIRAGRVATVSSTPISFVLPQLLKAQDADIVHLHFPYPLGEISQWLLRRGRATVMTYHSDVIRQVGILRVYSPLLRLILRRMDRILPTSTPYIHSSPYLRPLADRCTVVPLGIDVARFARKRRRQVQTLRNRYGHPILLFVGRLRYYKGLTYLIEAMKQVDATLLIIGTGPEAARLGEQAYLSGLAHRIRFLGDISDEYLPAFYQAADLFVLPSSHRSEAFGIVLLEAMAAGVPVISTELGTGTSWVNQHEQTGLVVPPCDSAALAEAINSLLADPERRARMGQAAAARAASHFDISVVVDQLLRVYGEVLGDTTSA
ncbi:MAG: glycosyltransferase [Chloroflexi bacterium]|nr:MAG: glycosyltransferase [Chloroflexota bacterium]